MFKDANTEDTSRQVDRLQLDETILIPSLVWYIYALRQIHVY